MLFALLLVPHLARSKECANMQRHHPFRDCAGLAQIDQPGSAIDAYIVGLRDVLERKAANIVQLQGRLESFQARSSPSSCQGPC